MPTDKLANGARNLAIATWPARFALQRFFQAEGADAEWDAVCAAIRPSTAHLVKRIRRSSNAKTLDELLGHPDADAALKDEERMEISEIRGHFRQDYWTLHAKKLAGLVKQGEAELAGVRSRLNKLRDIAVAIERSIQDEIFSKIAHYEDRILFAGEIVPFEILDQELAYYTDQRAIDPLEDDGRTTGKRKRPPEI